MQTQWLSEIRRGDIGVAGGKGANLGEMLSLGLPVPGGFCITTEAYMVQTAAWKLGERLSPLVAAQDWEAASAEAERVISSSPLADALVLEVMDSYRRMGEPEVAVRSSATAEDLEDASFAGQQETVLNVRGEDELLRGVRRCWASLWGPRAIHYRQERGIDHLSVSIALVVQEMVPADSAGVMFTVDPVTRETGRMLVEAAPGLGEAVVSGSVTGDLYRIDRTNGLGVVDREIRSPEKPVLTDDQIRQLSRLGLELESHFGQPQDVEFALAKGNLYLLQSRPITTLSAPDTEPIPPETRLSRWQQSVLPIGQERYPIAPKPLDNFYFDVMIGAVTNAVRNQGFFASPEEEEALKAQLWRDVYVSFPPIKATCRVLLAPRLIKRTIERDWDSWWAAYRDRLAEIGRPIPLTSLSDAELWERADAILAA